MTCTSKALARNDSREKKKGGRLKGRVVGNTGDRRVGGGTAKSAQINIVWSGGRKGLAWETGQGIQKVKCGQRKLV